MRLSFRCVVYTAVLAVVFSVVLVLVLAAVVQAVDETAVDPAGLGWAATVLAQAVRACAALVGARRARREGLGFLDTLLSCLVGIVVGYAVWLLSGMFSTVVVVGRPFVPEWGMLRDLALWLPAAPVAVLLVRLAARRRRRRRRPSPA